MSKKYLLKIEFDCNDADYVYGCKIISESEKNIIESNGNKLVSFGSCDFGEAERTADETLSITELTDEEASVIERLGLNGFGEGSFWSASELLSADEYQSEEEETEEDESVVEKNHVPHSDSPDDDRLVAIKRTMDDGYGSYFLKEKNPESNRETAHVIFGIKYERISNKDRATMFSKSEAKKIIKELNYPEFEFI